MLILISLFACNSEDSNNCFQTAGKTIQQQVEVPAFETILVNRNVQLILKQGETVEVVVETGENLINDVEVLVVDNQLRITDHNTCNYVREYNAVKVFVTSPNVVQIRSSTQFETLSDGVLSYPEIELISEEFHAPDAYTVGDFKMQLDVQRVRVVSNGLSSFYLSGQTEDLFVGFYSGDGRFEGDNLTAQNIEVFHRGSNAMVVNPQQSLTGELRGTGNLITVNEPPVVEVEQFYTGELIFE